ncbi:hypothetical protein HJG60_010029 [Phyllostomus discolor]|uniref:Uncharacterized protein n=1 Tax=Phyllostomus discolor TaxID=89673 RepID=A0A834AXL1_9CHIR|nr:hypothetical protein HJG60_010029 [Phyllostomus discolor]
MEKRTSLKPDEAHHQVTRNSGKVTTHEQPGRSPLEAKPSAGRGPQARCARIGCSGRCREPPSGPKQSPSLAGKFQMPRTPGAIGTPAAQARHSRKCLRQVSPFTCASASPGSNNGPADRVLWCGLEHAPRHAGTTFPQRPLGHREQGQGPLTGGRPDSLLQVPTSSHQPSKVPSVVSKLFSENRAARWGAARGVCRGRKRSICDPRQARRGQPEQSAGCRGVDVTEQQSCGHQRSCSCKHERGNMHRGVGAEPARNTRKRGGRQGAREYEDLLLERVWRGRKGCLKQEGCCGRGFSSMQQRGVATW